MNEDDFCIFGLTSSTTEPGEIWKGVSFLRFPSKNVIVTGGVSGTGLSICSRLGGHFYYWGNSGRCDGGQTSVRSL